MGQPVLDIETVALAARGGYEGPPNDFQLHTVIVACVMILVAAVIWMVPYVRDAAAGLKLLVVATHEVAHLFTGWAMGGHLKNMCIDPNEGGRTVFIGLRSEFAHPTMYDHSYNHYPTHEQMHVTGGAAATLLAGYLWSAIIGFIYIFCAFDIVASKGASFTIAFGLLLPLLRAVSFLPFISVACLEGLLIGLWFGDHGNALRFFVLLVGVMNLFYPMWDFIDAAVFEKINESDCEQLALNLGGDAGAWLMAWTFFDCLMFVSAIFAGMAAFKKTPEQMYASAASFLPTR